MRLSSSPRLALLSALALSAALAACSSDDGQAGPYQGSSAGGQSGAGGQGGASGGKAGSSTSAAGSSSAGSNSAGSGTAAGGSAGSGTAAGGSAGSGSAGSGSAGSAGAGAAATAGAAGAAGSSSPAGGKLIGQPYEGGLFHLGPVDWDETAFHNACAPGEKYSQAVRQAESKDEMLAGLWVGIADVASLCDACIVVDTKKGKTAVLRVVTYGDTTPNSIDVSPAAYALLNSGEDPREMTWQLVECPDTGGLMLEFQTGSSEWWTSLWVRNARVPIVTAEVKSANHPDWAPLERGSDGTLTDGGGFGKGDFSLRLTGADGQQLVVPVAWPEGGVAGKSLGLSENFP